MSNIIKISEPQTVVPLVLLSVLLPCSASDYNHVLILTFSNRVDGEV